MSIARIVIDDILVVPNEGVACDEVQVAIIGCALIVAIHLLRIAHVLREPLSLILSSKIVFPFLLSIRGGCYPTL